MNFLDDYLSNTQLRSLAVLMRLCAGDAAAFAKGIIEARQLAGRPIRGEQLWRQIAEEISLLETSEALNRRLESQDAQSLI